MKEHMTSWQLRGKRMLYIY